MRTATIPTPTSLKVAASPTRRIQANVFSRESALLTVLYHKAMERVRYAPLFVVEIGFGPVPDRLRDTVAGSGYHVGDSDYGVAVHAHAHGVPYGVLEALALEEHIAGDGHRTLRSVRKQGFCTCQIVRLRHPNMICTT